MTKWNRLRTSALAREANLKILAPTVKAMEVTDLRPASGSIRRWETNGMAEVNHYDTICLGKRG